MKSTSHIACRGFLGHPPPTRPLMYFKVWFEHRNILIENLFCELLLWQYKLCVFNYSSYMHFQLLNFTLILSCPLRNVKSRFHSCYQSLASCVGVILQRTWICCGLLDAEDKGTAVLWIAMNLLCNNVISHPRLESSAAILWEPHGS